MNKDEIQQMVNQVIAQTENEQDHTAIEFYINGVASFLTEVLNECLARRLADIPEPTRSQLDEWQRQNKNRVSLRIGVATQILLRKELLGE